MTPTSCQPGCRAPVGRVAATGTWDAGLAGSVGAFWDTPPSVVPCIGRYRARRSVGLTALPTAEAASVTCAPCCLRGDIPGPGARH